MKYFNLVLLLHHSKWFKSLILSRYKHISYGIYKLTFKGGSGFHTFIDLACFDHCVSDDLKPNGKSFR